MNTHLYNKVNMPDDVLNDLFEYYDSVCEANGTEGLTKSHLKQAIKIFLSDLPDDDMDLLYIVDSWYNNALTDTEPREEIYFIILDLLDG